MAASPSLPFGSLYLPVRTRMEMLTNGSSRFGTTNATGPLLSGTRYSAPLGGS